MTPARDVIIARILEREGGVADVGDGKGITRYGQTPAWLAQFGLPTPTTKAYAAANYAVWLQMTKLDRLIGDEADSLADVVIDYAVHSGHVVAICALQAAVGATTDGVIGPRTLALLTTPADRRTAAAHVIASRMNQQGYLIAQNPGKFAKYAHGWARRNAEHVRGLAW